MAYRNGNYSAFYVVEPFSEGNFGCQLNKGFRLLQLAPRLERRGL